MLGYFKIKKFSFFEVVIPLPILSLIFAFVCTKKFYRFFQSTALEVVCRELKETPNMEIIYKSFIPSSLSGEKSGEVHVEGAFSYVTKVGSSDV